MAAWVAPVGEGAVRNTRDVDILLRKEDADSATVALAEVGFHRDETLGVTIFLDGPDGVPYKNRGHSLACIGSVEFSENFSVFTVQLPASTASLKVQQFIRTGLKHEILEFGEIT